MPSMWPCSCVFAFLCLQVTRAVTPTLPLSSLTRSSPSLITPSFSILPQHLHNMKMIGLTSVSKDLKHVKRMENWRWLKACGGLSRLLIYRYIINLSETLHEAAAGAVVYALMEVLTQSPDKKVRRLREKDLPCGLRNIMCSLWEVFIVNLKAS